MFDDFSANFFMPRSISYDPGPGTSLRLRLLPFPLESPVEGAGAHVPPKTPNRNFALLRARAHCMHG